MPPLFHSEAISFVRRTNFIKKPACRNMPVFGGRRWIRTIEAKTQQIYSLPPLATREFSHIGAGGRT